MMPMIDNHWLRMCRHKHSKNQSVILLIRYFRRYPERLGFLFGDKIQTGFYFFSLLPN